MRVCAKAQRAPIMRTLRYSDRGPGWSFRPDASPPSIFGEHQAGIASPKLDHLVLAAFDHHDGELEAWSAHAEELMAASPGDLTLTIGFGASLFDRLGLNDRRPTGLRDLPAFDGDDLDPSFCGGDLCLVACATDAGGAAAALDHVSGGTPPRWRQRGFVHREPGRGPARDLLGFRDGTMNLRRGRQRDQHVWAGRGDRSWMAGGTYLVVRRIRIDLRGWSRLSLDEQQRAVGHHKESGAPLGGRREFDPLPLEATRDGEPVIPLDAHARLAAPRSIDGASLLRRSYSYDDGPDDKGLLFLAYCRDPQRQYVPVQRRLAEGDALNAHVTHVGSALFAIPPGARPGAYIGAGLLSG
jgi:deferrochelatase/peroxidase EfeB